MEVLRNAEVWVFVGLLIFAALLIYLKVPTAATRALDARGAKIQAALDEAEQLRGEARRLLDELSTRRAEIEVEAARMLSDAEAAARMLEAEARTRLEAQITRRTELADRRIAAAEAQASADVRAAAATFAVEASRAILASRLSAQALDPQVEPALARLATARRQ